MTRRPNHPGFAVLTALTLLLIAATTGCAADSPTVTAAGTAPATASLRVGLLEWQILTSSRALTAGLDHLTVTNTGTTAHDLRITGAGVDDSTKTLPPGGTTTLTITTRRGTSLTLTCDLPGHEQAGMHTRVAVT